MGNVLGAIRLRESGTKRGLEGARGHFGWLIKSDREKKTQDPRDVYILTFGSLIIINT